MEFYHDPVMKIEVLEALELNKGGLFVDCTLGGGGHSEAILAGLKGSGELVAFDRDPEAIEHATKRLEKFENKRIVHQRFSTLSSVLEGGSVHGILCDLGISSRQVDRADRGFSFKNSSEIDLRMNPAESEGATEWIRANSLEDIQRSLSKNADMKKAYRLAKALKEEADAVENAMEMARLLKIIEGIFPEQKNKSGSLAARVLQALRMEVNEELFEIEEVIKAATQVLAMGGRLVFLTYHSVEDRLVKVLMKKLENPEQPPKHIPVAPEGLQKALFKAVTRKAVLPSEQEIAINPRARSAKMRVYEKL